MSISNPKKTVQDAAICYGEKTRVTISFDAAAEIYRNPVDVVLLVDRSGSMDCGRMKYVKELAKSLVDRILQHTDQQEQLNRVAVVSFADTASKDVDFTNNEKEVYSAISNLSSGGSTNHKDAFEKAWQILEPKSLNRQILVLFTDGKTTVGGDSDAMTEKIKEAGVEIFCVGLTNDSVPLHRWASDPVDRHVIYAYEPDGLEGMFEIIISGTIESGAMDIVIREEIASDFKIVSIHKPSAGCVKNIGPQSFLWTIHEAGTSEAPETVSVSFDIMHIGCGTGLRHVNKSLVYNDREGHCVEFPNPVIEILCDSEVYFPEHCPVSTQFKVGSCEDTVRASLEDVELDYLGRIVQVNVEIKDVCPGKRLAVGVFLTELNEEHKECSRGVKMFTVPPIKGTHCRNLKLKCINFIVPEEAGHNLCKERVFKARAMANYIDADLKCCCDI